MTYGAVPSDGVAFSEMVLLTQYPILVEPATTAGNGFTTTDVDPVPEHPFASVAVTKYVPPSVRSALLLEGLAMLAENDDGPDQI